MRRINTNETVSSVAVFDTREVNIDILFIVEVQRTKNTASMNSMSIVIIPIANEQILVEVIGTMKDLRYGRT
jgi:hypothetical protein